MSMIHPAQPGDTTTNEYADSLAESLRIIWQQIADQHGDLADGKLAANVMWHATRAMLDHVSGARRGITMQTWARYVRMLLADPDECITVLYRLHNNAHWHPAAAA